jgi:hypothetical protein
MKVNEVIQREAPNYGDDPKTKQFATIGRTLMDISAKMKITKTTPDEEIAKSNRMAAFGDALTRFGTTWGPRNLAELLKDSGCSKEEAMEFMNIAKKAGPVKPVVKDPEPEADEPEDDMDGPDDDEVARQADMVARGK